MGDSDLDLAWKQLNFARVIVEKSPNDNAMEKFKILFALAEVSMERGGSRCLSTSTFNLLMVFMLMSQHLICR